MREWALASENGHGVVQAGPRPPGRCGRGWALAGVTWRVGVGRRYTAHVRTGVRGCDAARALAVGMWHTRGRAWWSVATWWVGIGVVRGCDVAGGDRRGGPL